MWQLIRNRFRNSYIHNRIKSTYVCAKFELIIRNNKSGIFFGDENVPLLFS